MNRATALAGVCVNVAFYGMWRTLALVGRAPGWLTGVLLVLGALSALLGIAHAAVQNRLSRVIAYSSIENTGLIVTGFGVALTGTAVGDPTLAGLPPTAGFVSEWFLLESLMQQFRVPGLGYRLVLALAGAAVALTVG